MEIGQTQATNHAMASTDSLGRRDENSSVALSFIKYFNKLVDSYAPQKKEKVIVSKQTESKVANPWSEHDKKPSKQLERVTETDGLKIADAVICPYSI